jgi:predicted nucleic acid-binding protein
MALDSIVIDNTVFNFFLKISDVDLSNILRYTITGRVLVPSKIVGEMENIARKFPEHSVAVQKLQNQIIKNNFFIHCHSFDSVVLEFAKKHIDKGEAEAISQCIKRRIPYFITDDFRCLPFITKHYTDINVNSTFFLLAIADLHGLIRNYKQVFQDYHNIIHYSKMRTTKKSEHQKRLIDEYNKAAKLFDIKIIKDKLDAKTNISKLLLN